MMEEHGYQNDYIALRAYEIEQEQWEDYHGDERPVLDNLEYIMEGAVKRYNWFIRDGCAEAGSSYGF
tara:strand:+ start:43 stop:243 length:201 start_codon:yes stop_codon:yes gene_type:complete